MPFGALRFEVYGRVQGVYFRKHTVVEAQRLGLVGWCANTARGTVVGEFQGPAEALSSMKHWLAHTGSPSSHIERVEFSHERHLGALQFDMFTRRPNVP